MTIPANTSLLTNATATSRPSLPVSPANTGSNGTVLTNGSSTSSGVPGRYNGTWPLHTAVAPSNSNAVALYSTTGNTTPKKPRNSKRVKRSSERSKKLIV